MHENPLEVIDGLALGPAHRELLRPGEVVRDAAGRSHTLPRFFYVIVSWEAAKRTLLSPHFRLSELLSVDCREATLLLEEFPHYAPCTLSILARYLEAFRARVEAPVYIRANGGYRSPAHGHSRPGSLHSWGCAADIYRIGDTFLEDQTTIEKYARLANSLAPEISVKPYGHGDGEADDHLHLDLGYVTFVPRESDEAR